MISSIATLLPYEEIVDDLLIFEDGSVAFALELEGVSAETFGVEEFNAMHRNLRVLLNSLPDSLQYQFYWTRSGRLDVATAYSKLDRGNDPGPLVGQMVQARLSRWQEQSWAGELFENRLFIFGLKRFPQKPGQRSFTRMLKGTALPRAFDAEYQAQHEAAVAEVRRLQDEVVMLFDKQQIHPRRISGHDLTTLIWRHLNPERSLLEPSPDREYLPVELPGADLRKEWRYLQIGDSFLRVVSLKRLPDETYPGIIEALTQTSIPAPAWLAVNFRHSPKEKEIAKLQLKRNMAEAFQNKRNTKARIAVEEATQLEQDLIAGDEAVFHAEWLITLAAKSVEQLDRATQEILMALRQMGGAEGQAESAANLRLWLSALPGNAGGESDYRFRTLKTSNLADLIPIWMPYKGQGRPAVIFGTSEKTLAVFDPFDRQLPNYNSLVFGASGGGKSFLVQYLCMYLLRENPQLVFVDKGGSYRKFVQLMDGQYFEISDRIEYAINPLAVEPFAEKKAYLQTVVASMVREEGRVLSNDEKIVIDRALEFAHHSYGRLSIPKVVQAFREMPKDAADYLPIAERMARHLERWTTGVHGRLLGQDETKFDISADIAAIDLKGLEPYPDLMKIFMLYITELIWSVCQRDPARKKIIVFDEVWSLLATEAGSKLISELYRTLRKYGAGVISVSQGIHDFEAGGAGILANVGTIFVLRQSSTMPMDRIREVLNLSDRQGELAQQLGQVKGEYSEVLVAGDNSSFVARVTPTPYEYWIATSDARDRQVLQEALQRLPVPGALAELAEKWPKGVV